MMFHPWVKVATRSALMPNWTSGRRAGPEGERVDAARVHAVETGGGEVLRGGADGAPRSRAIEEEEEDGGEEDGDEEGGELRVGNRHAADVDVAARVRRVDGAEVGAEEQLREIDEDDVETEGDEQGVELRRADDEVQEEALEEVTEEEEQHHRDRQRREGIDAALRIEIINGVSAEHDERAVGEVDDVEDTPDEAHPVGHQAVEAPEQDPVDEDLGEELHGAAPLGRAPT